ncbi:MULTISPECIES: RDD family protein [unclassified Aureispira]|uniref:RDD family protein n=1 Tax=unclassified Aureispira TaxID=2649989 RepID=UPI000695E4DA|nr:MULTISPECIES: RDD family protein [unclassified Aureispira]WMX13659.1 RDD family protein [Aureispira sp. CCB-E]
MEGDELLDDNQTSLFENQMVHASFKQRLLAMGIDVFLLMSVYVLFSDLILIMTESSFLYQYLQLLSYLGIACYFAIGESSLRQGTIGKQWIGIKVVGHQKHRIGFGHALARFVVKLSLSPILLVLLLTNKTQNYGGILGTYVIEHKNQK